MKDLEILMSGTSQVLPEGALEKKLKSGKKLKIKLGMDPTAVDLHLGHAVVLNKLKQFQDLGHEIIFLIGDFTASIGDPSGKSKTRPALTDAEIKKNAQTYVDQISRVLDPKKITVRFNSEWLNKLSVKDMIGLLSKVTVAQLTERDDFSKRLKNKQPISMHELLYPIMQGYDSVALEADVELGGTDQTFNLLMGRALQEQYGKEPQVVLTMPILEGLDGKEKMSKSLGNAIGLTEPAEQAYGKLMSASDVLMWRFYELLLSKPKQEIIKMQADVESGKAHPMDLKKQMAFAVVEKFWSLDEAQKAADNFASLFQKKDYSDAKEFTVSSEVANPIWIVDLIKLVNAVESTSQAKRLIQDGAVKLDNEAVADFKAEVELKSGQILKVGKHKIYKLILS
jgi:tyrosyl-tRNA synthetase